MKAEPRSQPSPWHGRPLIKAVKGMVAVTFLGGCRLGMQGAPPSSREGGNANGSAAGPAANLPDGGVADAAGGR